MNCNDNAPKNCTIDSPEQQRPLYDELQAYSFADSIRDADNNIVAADYYLVDNINGIKYYTPNDEDWGSILAISDEHKLAHNTCFYEMDDMAAPNSDYVMVVVDGVMDCKFNFETA